jgi:hypothetical protein
MDGGVAGRHGADSVDEVDDPLRWQPVGHAEHGDATTAAQIRRRPGHGRQVAAGFDHQHAFLGQAVLVDQRGGHALLDARNSRHCR